MMTKKRPYLIAPKLIEQPTWGGEYILRIKDWVEKQDFLGKKIGQSYELFSGSKLLLKVTDSQDEDFKGELGSPDESTIFNDTLYKNIPLIKINQSKGNSFQIHIKKSDGRWVPKMESCYYLEDGVATFGIKKNADLSDYRNTCLIIDKKMNELSLKV